MNSKLSKGPKTPSGKTIASQKPLKHGLQAACCLLPDEDQAELARMGEDLLSTLKPEDELENALVMRIISLCWRLRRPEKIEARILSWKYHDTLDEDVAFAHDCQQQDALSKLSRYEAAIERSLYKALHELERRQAARQGKEVPPPIAVDVNVSGIENPRN
jgi:hypothetical protein